MTNNTLGLLWLTASKTVKGNRGQLVIYYLGRALALRALGDMEGYSALYIQWAKLELRKAKKEKGIIKYPR